MKLASIALAALALGWAAPPARSAELRKIDRTVGKEPRYAAQPRYALLVFGPEAKTRVWLVLDSQVLYVDRNGNGDLTEANERIEPDPAAAKKSSGEFVYDMGAIAGARLQLRRPRRDPGDRDAGVTDEQHALLKGYREDHKKHGWESASLVRISEDGIQVQNPVVFCQKPKDAQVSHLNGPLTSIVRSAALAGTVEPLKRGAEELFAVCIGTPGLATRNYGYAPIFSRLTTSEVPAGLHPLAKFEFPHRDPDKPAVKVEVALDRRC